LDAEQATLLRSATRPWEDNVAAHQPWSVPRRRSARGRGSSTGLRRIIGPGGESRSRPSRQLHALRAGISYFESS